MANPVNELMDELHKDPKRFRNTGGYERLVEALADGHAPDAVNRALSDDAAIAGDLLWVIAELEAVDPFVPSARRYLSSLDKGAAAYAMEIVLRGGQMSADLRAAFDQLNFCDVAVCEHAVRTLAAEGLSRLTEILKSVDQEWTTTLAKRLSQPVSRGEIEELLTHASPDRQVVGAALATLGRERDRSFADSFARSSQAWIREYGEWLGQTVEHPHAS